MAQTPESLKQDLSHDFSPVLGGPVFQLLRKSHLSGAALELLPRRIIVIPMIAWLPLLLLDSFSGSAGRLSFLHDVEAHVRFLVALPVLIAAELIVHLRTRPVVHRFVERRIVLPDDLSRFDRAIESGIRLRNSILLELGLVVLVYTFGLWLWSRRIAIQSPTWYAMPGGRWNLTYAGYWYVFVSIPIVQFALLRWYMRFLIWYHFLWQVSRINLKLVPTYPDRCGGLSFLGRSAYAFGPVLFAQGAMLAGVIASRVLYRGENLLSFRVEIVAFIAFFVFAVLTPLLMFTPQMVNAKRKGLVDYGKLAQDYVDNFDQKWIVRAPSAAVDDLLGTPDIQSLADLGNSYSVVASMRSVPFGINDITRLAVITAVPFFPLLLTIFSPEELVIRLIKALF
jgi:hypothetical protein